jgi:SAM-dependent methyltransferase
VSGDVRYRWSAGDAYERYVGRWSRALAGEFVAWLALPEGARCMDVGCGTGALGATLLAAGAGEVLGLDRSRGYLAAAREGARDSRARFAVADAQSLPVRGGRFAAALSALVLNFVPRPERMIAEMARAVRPGGVVGVYVWDYAAGMEPIRRFWDAAVALDPAAAALDEGPRFPLCGRAALAALFEAGGLGAVEVRAIDVPATFRDFEDFWEPFLSGEGPAPGYCAALGEDQRAALRESLRRALPAAPDGTIALNARAWAARGVRAS